MLGTILIIMADLGVVGLAAAYSLNLGVFSGGNKKANTEGAQDQ